VAGLAQESEDQFRFRPVTGRTVAARGCVGVKTFNAAGAEIAEGARRCSSLRAPSAFSASP
jgi:hypothetical protein